MTLNDPVYVEAAQALARASSPRAAATVGERVAYRLPPVPDPPAERRGGAAACRTCSTRPQAEYAADAGQGDGDGDQAARPGAEGGGRGRPRGVDGGGNVLLNLDETLAKR